MFARRVVLALSLLTSLAAFSLSGCGRSTVSMVVVRPAMINARPYGGTVSIAGFAPARPDFAIVAGQLRQELAQRVLEGVGGVVQLRDYGGGLVVSGTVDDYSMVVSEQFETTRCTETVSVTQNGVTKSQQVTRDCTQRWYVWHARAVVTLRVNSAQGQGLMVHPFVAERHGETYKSKDSPPPPPNPHPLLQQLRTEIVDQMAKVIVPHRERVSATFFDCAKPAEDACEAGVKFMANSNYDAAAQAFSEGIRLLEVAKAEREEVAKAYYDRGLVYQYSRRFDLAITDLQKALSLDDDGTYRSGLQAVEQERAAHQALLEQGLGGQ